LSPRKGGLLVSLKKRESSSMLTGRRERREGRLFVERRRKQRSRGKKKHCRGDEIRTKRERVPDAGW